MENLPFGVQDFEKIRKDDFLYVDKTSYIHKLITEGSYYFIARPRRFGKSLLVNTLKEIFLGNKHLFEGLWIENKWDWKPYPIIKIDFSEIDYSNQTLQVSLQKYLKKIADFHTMTLQGETAKELFGELIEKLYEKYQTQVVLLIDEYDRPIIDYLDNLEQVEVNKQTLKNFYGIIKPSDSYLKFVFLTGVSKFSKVSIFSDLNNLLDISTSPVYAGIAGYTQAELETYFEDRITQMADYLQFDRNYLLVEIQKWYNGYSWDTQTWVYNPFSVLAFFQNKKFANYWFSTGTPTFLIKLLRDRLLYDIKSKRLNINVLDTHEPAKIAIWALLFQTGYLTLKKSFPNEIYELGYPNKEVEQSMTGHLLGGYAYQPHGDAEPMVIELWDALEANDFEQVKPIFNALFGTIPQDFFVENREKFYHAIVYLTFHLLGYYATVEEPSGIGRMDTVVHLDNKIVIFEFKLDKTAKEAIEQIYAKGYADKYQNTKKDIYLLGVNMQSSKKQIDEILIEKI